jgi:hypothetical protein
MLVVEINDASIVARRFLPANVANVAGIDCYEFSRHVLELTKGLVHGTLALLFPLSSYCNRGARPVNARLDLAAAAWQRAPMAIVRCKRCGFEAISIGIGHKLHLDSRAFFKTCEVAKAQRDDPGAVTIGASINCPDLDEAHAAVTSQPTRP